MGSLYVFDPSDPVVPNRGLRFRTHFATINEDGPTQKYQATGRAIIASVGVRNTKWNGSAIVELSQAEKDAIAAAELAAQQAAAIADAKDEDTLEAGRVWRKGFNRHLRKICKDLHDGTSTNGQFTPAGWNSAKNSEIDGIVTP